MKNLKYRIPYHWLVVFAMLALSVACDDEDEENDISLTEITAMVPLGSSSDLNSGLPEELIRVEGLNIRDMKRILLNGSIPVAFNPALNSNTALFFNVPPFDASVGSKFGIQDITFIKANGTEVVKTFDVEQPEPLINVNNEYEPAKAVSNEVLTVRGEWFINVEEVLIDGDSVDFTIISDQELNFVFPEGPDQTVELTITTAAGSITRPLPIEGGFITYLVTNFDGDGVLQGGWINYGDSKFRLQSNLGVDGSIGGEIVWDNTGELPFTGCTSEMDIPSLTTATDAKNAFIVIDVNIIHPNTVLEFTLTDGQSDQWLTKPPSPEETGWQTIEIPLAIFGDSFTPDLSDQSDVDPNPATITKINMQISQEGDAAPIPSGYQFDNIRLKVLEL